MLCFSCFSSWRSDFAGCYSLSTYLTTFLLQESGIQLSFPCNTAKSVTTSGQCTTKMLPATRHAVSASTRQPLANNTSSQILRAAATTGTRSLSTTQPAQGVTLLQDKKDGFGFARSNPRPPKPRSKGVTEIRGPYYTVCLLWIVQSLTFQRQFRRGEGWSFEEMLTLTSTGHGEAISS